VERQAAAGGDKQTISVRLLTDSEVVLQLLDLAELIRNLDDRIHHRGQVL
jgi:hypothetical protein